MQGAFPALMQGVLTVQAASLAFSCFTAAAVRLQP